MVYYKETLENGLSFNYAYDENNNLIKVVEVMVLVLLIHI